MPLLSQLEVSWGTQRETQPKFKGSGQVKYLPTDKEKNINKYIAIRSTENNQESKNNMYLSGINVELIHEITLNSNC